MPDPIKNTHYRNHSTGSVLRYVGRDGDGYLMRMVELGDGARSDLQAWAECNPNAQVITGDFPLANIERELAKRPTAQERFEFLVNHTMEKPLVVERAWFEFAAVEVKGKRR